MARPTPNFVILDGSLPDVWRLVAAMLKARQAIESRSWSHPQEPTTEEWWADVLADPRAQIRKRRGSEQAVSRTFYRLADEPRASSGGRSPAKSCRKASSDNWPQSSVKTIPAVAGGVG